MERQREECGERRYQTAARPAAACSAAQWRPLPAAAFIAGGGARCGRYGAGQNGKGDAAQTSSRSREEGGAGGRRARAVTRGRRARAEPQRAPRRGRGVLLCARAAAPPVGAAGRERARARAWAWASGGPAGRGGPFVAVEAAAGRAAAGLALLVSSDRAASPISAWRLCGPGR